MKKFFQIALSISALAPSVVLARDPGTPSCADTVKACFVASSTDRSKCFLDVSKSPSCVDLPLGDLTARRAAMIPPEPTGLEVAPSPLGPQVVDKTCVENFDNEWSSVMIQGPLTGQMLRQLNSKLAACVQVAPQNFLRP